MKRKYPLNYQPNTRASNYKKEDFQCLELRELTKKYGLTEEEGIAILNEYSILLEELLETKEEKGVLIPGLGVFYFYAHRNHLKFKNTKDT